MRGKDATWVGFLAACFVVVGLAGVFATYAVPLPYERALAHLRVSTNAPTNAAGQSPKPQDAGDRGRPLADTEAEAVLRDAAAEARGIASSVRALLVVLTLMAAVFGTVVMRASQRQPG